MPGTVDIWPGTLLAPYSLLWGAFMIAGFAAQGAAFVVVMLVVQPWAEWLFRRGVDHTSAVFY